MSLEIGQQQNQTTQPAQGQGVNSNAGSQPTNATLLGQNPTQSASMADWKSGFDSDTQALVGAKGWKGPQDMAKSYMGLEKLVGGKNIVQPKEGASEQEWNSYYEKLGRPSKSDDYKLERSKDFQFYDEKATSQYKQIAHKAGLTPKQAQIVHDEFYAYENKIYAEQKAAQQDRTQEVGQNMRKEWGAAYDQNIKMAEAAATELFKDNPELIEALHNTMGEGFYKMVYGYAKNTTDPRMVTGRDNANWAIAPDQALREIKRLQGDGEFNKKWLNNQHPEHEYAKNEMTRLNRLAYPDNK